MSFIFSGLHKLSYENKMLFNSFFIPIYLSNTRCSHVYIFECENTNSHDLRCRSGETQGYLVQSH